MFKYILKSHVPVLCFFRINVNSKLNKNNYIGSPISIIISVNKIFVV